MGIMADLLSPFCGVCLGDIEKGEPGYTSSAFATAQDGWKHSDGQPHDHLVVPKNTERSKYATT